MENEFDAIVVGGGPAGSACAVFLARKGTKVLLVDKAVFPRDKVCGDAISGKSISVLRELGLEQEIEKRPHGKVNGVTLSSPNGSIVKIPIPKNYGRKGEGYCARREVFDNMLFETAIKEKNVSGIQGFLATDLIIEENFVKGIKGTELKTKELKEFRAKLVVGADGSHSIVASKLGVNVVDNNHYVTAIRAYYDDVKDLDGTIEIHFVEELIPGYFWIFPLEDGKANVGAGMLFSDLKKRDIKLPESMFKTIQQNKLFKERFQGAKLIDQVRGWTLPLGSKHRKMAFNGAVLLGDAASLIDPFTGEGIGNALVSAKLASKVITQALEELNYSEEFLKQYEKMLWEELDTELQTSYKMQRLGKYKFILNLVIGKAAKKPKLRETLSHTLVSEKPFKEIVTPLGLLKMLLT